MLIPLRGVVTIALTVFTGFAVMVCVYQYGSLPPGPFGHLDGVSFFVPPVAATIVLGLSLDYDVRAAARVGGRAETRRRAWALGCDLLRVSQNVFGALGIAILGCFGMFCMVLRVFWRSW